MAVPELDEYARMVTEIICKKNDRFSEYAEDLANINLIILDTEGCLFQILIKDFYTCFYTPGITAALRKSGFREIYFVTRLETDLAVYVPMKLVLLRFEWCLLNHLLSTHYSSLLVVPRKKLLLFAQFLRRRGMSEVYTRTTEDGSEIVWSGYGVRMDEDEQPMVHDYTDCQTPDDCVQVNFESGCFFIDDDFDKRLRVFLPSYTFSCGIAYPVKNWAVPS
jgi:hypothetical protein